MIASAQEDQTGWPWKVWDLQVNSRVELTNDHKDHHENNWITITITIATIFICCYSEMEFVEIMAGVDQNTPDSLIEEHVNKIKEEIV